ncbi:TenA family transcriptional regulator [Achromobacter sp. NFACC18-2]|uniref:TenA family transcriptional regulator n=1 Tax=Achromobacter sp. NFACC18-2 TaxID=1564112 RepID=UPI0008D8712A|nr:iron-containing redox enzyme family protein [Achromobacter sp. NFACC18-2]SEI46307.1 Pyrroloquinoline quinone (PQQ) biosynthesis protein C [Achromobacter sp. NFACC18-2]
MTFFEQLLDGTRQSRESLVTIPIIQDCLQGKVTLPAYAAFLREAYHHVSHTVPLMHACRARIPERLAWMRPEIDEYIEEETGHDAWILNDLRALGDDPDAVRRAGPGPQTEVMVAYAYDTISRRNPVGFFGMVHVLEGTSVTLALNAADQIQRALALPASAFSYLRSHGTLDQAHTAHFAELMNRLDSAEDQSAVIHAANMFYRLYGAIFRALPRAQPQEEAA